MGEAYVRKIASATLSLILFAFGSICIYFTNPEALSLYPSNKTFACKYAKCRVVDHCNSLVIF